MEQELKTALLDIFAFPSMPRRDDTGPCRAYLLVASTLIATCAGAAYPDKPIRLVVPSAPGGGTDIIARMMAQGLYENWGQTVVVDNRGGAGGIPGVATVAKGSAPDGYTMLLGSVGHLSFAPALRRNLGYDPQKDLAPISLVANQPFVLAVVQALPVASVKEFIALAKSKPGTISYGSGGSGTASHLGTELLQLTAGFTMLHVPYKGTGPALPALMANEIQALLVGTSAVIPHVKTGRLKALAVTTSKRSAAMPDLPTIAEGGVPGYSFDVWYGMMYPGGTPRAIVMKAHAEILKLLKSPALSERYAAGGIEPLSSTPEEFAALIKRELPRWHQVVKAAKITVE
jgi:tripartite-type tricarboxylate transporter receptor subunit TctC